MLADVSSCKMINSCMHANLNEGIICVLILNKVQTNMSQSQFWETKRVDRVRLAKKGQSISQQ